LRAWCLLWPYRVANLLSRTSVLAPDGVPVSMTTHGPRVRTTHLALESIAMGRLRPSRLVLWLCDPKAVAELTPGLRRLQKRGLEVRLTAELGPHTKYFPALDWPELTGGPLVTADDDVLYPPGWLEGLKAARDQAPDLVHAYRAHTVTWGERGLRPYEAWQPCMSAEPSHRHFATGVSGVIYPPGLLARLRAEGDRFLGTCPRADDVWLHMMAVRHGFPVRQIQCKPLHFPFIPGTRDVALMAGNVRGGGNDAQIRATYGDAEMRAMLASPEVMPVMDGEGWFNTRSWYELLLAHGLSQGQQVRWHSLKDTGGEPCAELPLMRQGRWTLASLSNFYSPVFSPVWRTPARMARVNWSHLARELAGQQAAAILRLQPMAEQAMWWSDFQLALEKMGYATYVYFCFGNWYEPFSEQASFEAYWAQRPSRLKHTVERARRRLDRSHAWQVELLGAPGDALERGILAYQRVYASSWKPEEPFPNFMSELMRMAASQGRLRLGLLSIDGAVVAAQVWIVDQGTASIFKLAYLPGHERLSPGSVLTAALMAHVIDVDRVRQVDYLVGDDAYKQDWMSHRRTRVGLVAFRITHPMAWGPWARHVGGLCWRWLTSALQARMQR
jgi:Acetyltransferase (GNAT) domain